MRRSLAWRCWCLTTGGSAVSLDNHNGNPVLSIADANRVLIENGATGFLNEARVVFVR